MQKRFQLGDESLYVHTKKNKNPLVLQQKRKDPNWKNDSGTIATIKIAEEIRELQDRTITTEKTTL